VRIEEVSDDIVDLLGCKLEDIIYASENWFRCRKYFGCFIENSLSKGNVDEPLLIFDSHYNPFRGIEVIFRVINGEIKGPKD
jgi:GTP-binding protein LepA